MEHGPLHRRRGSPDPAVTDSTMLSTTVSVVSSSNNHNRTARTGAVGSGGGSQTKKKGRWSRFKLKGFNNILKRGGKRTLSEAQLRKKVRKAAEKGDWDCVRKLVTNYQFSDIPEATPARRGSANPSIIQEEPATSRRPSYGSRKNGERLSFTGKESAAAAAMIKAAALEESEGSNNGLDDSGPSSEQRLDTGENILHDVCRFRPPADVVETLLTALRHRRGFTSGTDDQGRTPLHLAADSGALPEIIDALICADPTPATMGDKECRSPLHLAMRSIVYPVLPYGRTSKNLPQEEMPTPEENLERTYKTVKKLKEAMLTYPGKVDFKDEDKSGYSPLDYAIDGNISTEKLIQCLIRRKEPRTRRSTRQRTQKNFTTGRSSTRSISGSSAATSVTEDQDMEVFLQLEQVEIETRKHRIEKIKMKRQKAVINDALFDMFGIEEKPSNLAAAGAPVANVVNVVPSQVLPSGSQKTPDVAKKLRESIGPTDSAIYRQHLEDYMNDAMDDFEGDLDYCDDDGFDMYADPEEDSKFAHAQPNDGAAAIVSLPDMIFVDQDDCVSVVSEVTVPFSH
ncbi:hypothetical protein ACHAXR_002565 [Thalassiosira sp. AJA248-18]